MAERATAAHRVWSRRPGPGALLPGPSGDQFDCRLARTNGPGCAPVMKGVTV